jgi:hypothetical protein
MDEIPQITSRRTSPDEQSDVQIVSLEMRIAY